MKPNKYNYNNQTGLYRHKVTFGKREIVKDEYLQESEQFTIYGSWFAMKKTQKSDEVLQAGQEQQKVIDRYVFKYAKSLNDLIEEQGTGFQIVCGGKTYDVISAINDDGLNQTITVVGEVVNDGD